MEADNKKRITNEQRELMLEFMMKHTALATGRFAAVDGAKHKQRLLKELTDQLNSCASGVTKTGDKWMKSWQDWRSDAKAKAAALKREINKTGGGTIKAKPLTPLEEKLLSFLGPTIVGGHENVQDPLAAVPSTSSVLEVTSEPCQNSVIIELPQETINFLQLDDDAAQPTLQDIVTVEGEDGLQSSSSSSSSSERPKKRKRKGTSVTSSMESEEDPLFVLVSKQLEVEKTKIEIMKEQNVIARERLNVMTGACNAFTSAMVAMEQFFKRQ